MPTLLLRNAIQVTTPKSKNKSSCQSSWRNSRAFLTKIRVMFLDTFETSCFVSCCVLLSCQSVVLALVECWGLLTAVRQAHTVLGQTTSSQCYDGWWTCQRVTNQMAPVPTRGWRRTTKEKDWQRRIVTTLADCLQTEDCDQHPVS